METSRNSLQDARPLSKGGRSKSVDAGMLQVPPLCYKNPNRTRRSRSSTFLHSSSIQSTSRPPNGPPTHGPSNHSAGGIDSARAATDAEEKTPAFSSQNLEIKLTKVSPRGSFYELNPAALRLNVPSPVCWNRVEYIPSELSRRNDEEERLARRIQDWEKTTEISVLQRQLVAQMETGERRAYPTGTVNDQFTPDDSIQRSSHKSLSSPTSRSVANLPTKNALAKPLKKPTSTRCSRRNLAAAAELRAFTEGAFEWLAEQVLLEGFDIDGNSFGEKPSIPDSSAGSWDFSPRTPSNLSLPLLPAPLIVDEHGHVQGTLLQCGTEGNCHPNPSERGFGPQVSQGDTCDVEATSTYSYMKTCDPICEGRNSITIVVDTRPRDQTLLTSEQDPREASIEANNGHHFASPLSISTYEGLPRYHFSSTGSSQTRSPLAASVPRTQSNVAAISNTTVSTLTSVCCKLKHIHSEPAVEAQTPRSTTTGRPRANTVDGFVSKSRSIFMTPRKMVSKAMSEAVQIVTPRPSLATLSSLARPSPLSSPQAMRIATHASSTTENTERTFASVGHSNWDSTTTGDKAVWAPQRVLPGIIHSDVRVANSNLLRNASSNPFPFASVGPSSPRSGRVPVPPELC